MIRVKNVFDKIVVTLARIISEKTKEEAISHLESILNGIDDGTIVYLGFEDDDYRKLASHLRREITHLTTSTKIGTSFRLDRETMYHLIKLSEDSGLDKTKVLEIIINKTESINLDVQNKE